MITESTSFLPPLLPAGMLAAAIVAAAVGSWRPGAARWVAVAATLGGTVACAWGLTQVIAGDTLVAALGGWAQPVGIAQRFDALSGFIATLVCFIGLLVVVYPPSVGFQSPPDRKLPVHALVLLLLAGLLGVAMAADLFNLFVFLEIYSIAAYSLIALGGPLGAVAAFRYLVIGTIGSGLYLLGVGFVYFATGTLSMSDASQRLGELGATATVITAVVLMVAGLATKMALFPLHVWLPDAHSHAPPAAAALLASVQVKVAAYALIRIVFEVVPDNVLTAFPLLAIITWAGVGGVLFGSVMAIRQTEFKRMLAFSTVAQLGYIGIGIGLDTPLALIGALLLVLNHAFMKGTMFFVAGSVYEATGRKAISAFAGLGRRMPWTMTGFTIAAASMIGLPPTAGFFSKFYLVLGAADAGGTGTPWTWVVAVVVAVSSILTLTYFIPVLEAIWFKPDPDGDDAPACEARALAVLPVAVLAVGLLVIGFVNVSIVNDLLDPIAVSLLGPRG